VPSLSVCLLLDDAAEAAVRRLWRQLEDDGVTTLATYTHGRHVPHVTLAHVGTAEVGDVRAALDGLGPTEPIPVVFAALGAFTRSRCSLVPTPSVELLARQAAVADRLEAAGLSAGRYYRPGGWLPHLTLGPRLPVDRLTTLARRVYEVLPLEATIGRAAVVDTTVGAVYPLP
jgi:2'-5' RNA ligase